MKRVGEALGFLSSKDDAGTAAAKFQQFGSVGQTVGTYLAQAFELVVRAMTAVFGVAQGVAEGWNLIKPAIDILLGALSQLGTKLAETFDHLFRTSTATQQNGSAWVGLGNVIAFVVGVIVSAIAWFVATLSAGVSIASGAIGAVMSLFSGLADVITGVVFIIGGIINGSWTDIWTGMKLVAFGVVDAIIGVVLELAGAIAGVVDALSSLFGSGTQWQQGIRNFRESVRSGMAEGMGVQDLSFTKPAASPTGASAPRVQPLPPTNDRGRTRRRCGRPAGNFPRPDARGGSHWCNAAAQHHPPSPAGPSIATSYREPPGRRADPRHRGPPSEPRRGHSLVLAGPGVLMGRLEAGDLRLE